MRNTISRPLGAATAVFLIAVATVAATAPSDDFATSLDAWKKWRAERLSSPTGWLTLIGLERLKDGANRLGSAPGSELLLPPDRAPANVGTISVDHGKARLAATPGVAITADGKSVSGAIDLVSDAVGDPTFLETGSLNFFVIARGDELFLRVRDREAKLRREFHGLDYFPPAPNWRLDATFEANPPETKIPVPNVLGQIDATPSPGNVHFSVDGKSYSLVGLDDTGDGRIFLVYADRTNGHETYGGGRFLYTDPPKDGKVVVDFNRSYNPPCAFTAFATCPLPIPENRLPFRIEAGEKKFGEGHAELPPH